MQKRIVTVSLVVLLTAVTAWGIFSQLAPTVVGTINLNDVSAGMKFNTKGDGKLYVVGNCFICPEDFFNLIIVDAAGQKVEKSLQVGGNPVDVAFSPDGKLAYAVTIGPGAEGPGEIEVIDTTKQEVVKRIDLDGILAWAMEISPDGKLFYITDGRSLKVFDVEKGNELNTIKLSSVGALALALSADGTKAYITGATQESPKTTLSIIDLKSNSVVGTLTTSIDQGVQFYITLSPDGRTLYVPFTSRNSNKVKVIDVSDATKPAEVGEIEVGRTPIQMAISSDGTTGYVSNFNANTLSVVDLAARKMIATLNIGKQPFGVVVSPDGKFVYVGNIADKNITVIATGK